MAAAETGSGRPAAASAADADGGRPAPAAAAALACARAALVAGPVALAFFAGGFLDGPRAVALVGAGVVLAVLAAAAPRDTLLPATTAARVAIGAAFAYAGWIALSQAWAPVPDLAGDDAERALLYAVVLAAAAIAFRERAAARALEVLAAAGTVVVCGYGLSGRLLPGLITQHPQASAAGRLDQPLTYWNATGALAAIGLVLCARLAGDADRPTRVRSAGAAAAVPLGAACYLSFSRGALAALAAGLIALVALVPTRGALRAAALALSAGIAGALAAAASPGVRALDGSLAASEREGALVLLAVLALMAVAAVLARPTPQTQRLPLPRAAPWIAAAAIAALLVVPIAAAGGRQQAPPATGASTARLGSLGSNRYAYWRVALRTGADHPLAGVGASGFRAAWLERRDVGEVVRDAHSLELETFAELGVVGVALLAALLGGVALSAAGAHAADAELTAGPLAALVVPIAAAGGRQQAPPATGASTARLGSLGSNRYAYWRVALSAAGAHAADAELTAGPLAALVVWAFHSAIDWDWEMPALTLVAVVLAGAVLAQAVTAPRRSAAPRG